MWVDVCACVRGCVSGFACVFERVCLCASVMSRSRLSFSFTSAQSVACAHGAKRPWLPDTHQDGPVGVGVVIFVAKATNTKGDVTHGLEQHGYNTCTCYEKPNTWALPWVSKSRFMCSRGRQSPFDSLRPVEALLREGRCEDSL